MQTLNEKRWQLPIGTRPQVVWSASWTFRPGIESYLLKDLWTIHLVLYQARFQFDEIAVTLTPGTIVLMPPRVRTTTVFTRESTHLFAHFRYPENDKSPTISLPALYNPGKSSGKWEALFTEITEAWQKDPSCSEVFLWGVLHRMATIAQESEQPKLHPKVRLACQIIEERLGWGCSVAQIAQLVELSEPHLVRLFNASFGKTIIAYIGGRRLVRAHYLLKNSSLTIREIAKETGFSDIQHFNKAVKKEYNLPPRELRKQLIEN